MQVLGHEGMKRHSLCTDHAKLARLIRSTAVTGFSACPESRVVPGPAHLEQAQGHGAGIGNWLRKPNTSGVRVWRRRKTWHWNLVQARARLGRDLADTSPQAKGGELCRNLFYPGAPAWHRHIFQGGKHSRCFVQLVVQHLSICAQEETSQPLSAHAARWKKMKQLWRQ
jgi:hypothetical protein